jgi:hypothetical protein
MQLFTYRCSALFGAYCFSIADTLTLPFVAAAGGLLAANPPGGGGGGGGPVHVSAPVLIAE